MRSLVQVAVLAAAILLCETSAASAQQASLTGDTIGTSAPYRETVRNFLTHGASKVVGGSKAGDGAFPWQVSLGVSWIADPFKSHFCGGSVIDPRWIVTAAHCAIGLTPERVAVTAGTNVLGAGGSRVNVRRIVVKSDYSKTSYDNDIALMELFDALPMSSRIQPITFLDYQTDITVLHDGTLLSVVGWGATQQGGSVVRDLRYAEVPFVPQQACNGTMAYDGKVTSNMICAGLTAGQIDACQGDSGGPLSLVVAAKPRLAGIVSWGQGCAQPNHPGVYTRAAQYAGWVAACIAKPNDCQ